MIGRQEDLTRLRAAIATDRGGAAVVFLDGAIGVGKTALLAELLASHDLPRVLFARGGERLAHIPLDGIRGIVETLLDADLPLLLAEGASMRTLRQRIRHALGEAPALLVIDDAHWLDQDSLDMLAALLSDPLPGGTSFVFAHRSSLAPKLLPYAATRGGLRVSRLTLAPLDEDASRRLLAQYGSSDPEILRLAGGNPLFLRLLAEGRGTSPDWSTADDEALADLGPSSIDDTLRTEIALLPVGARTLLHALSLAPAPPPSALAALTGMADASLLEASDELAARGLTDPRQLEILHPLIRAAAYRDMDAATRRRMHRAAAAQMSGSLDGAVHLRHLGAYLTEAELDALMHAASTVMPTAPHSALKLLERTRRIPHRDRDLLLARALLIDGRPGQGEELLRTLLADGDVSKEASALLIQSLRIQGRPDEAVELVREVTDGEGHPEIAVEAATLMVMHEGAQDPSLIVRAAGVPAPPGVAAALSALTALAHLRHGDVVRAREPYETARDGFLSLAASDMLPVIEAVTAAGWSAHMVGDFRGGVTFVERAIRLAERNGRFHALPHLYCILAFLYIPLDRGAEAEELAEQAIDAAERYDWPEVVPLATTAALVAAPDREATEKWYRRLAALRPPTTWWWRRVVELFRARVEIRFGIPIDRSVLVAEDGDVFVIQNHIGLGELALRHGDIAAAQRHSDHAIALGERFGVPYLTGQGALFRAEVLRATGRTADAEAAALAAVAHFTDAGAPLYVRNARAWLRKFVEAADPPAQAHLTSREREVADLVANGLTNREIAERLYLSPRTVEDHVARILRKRGLRSRAGLARKLDG
ncbi:AAA family ATPase [Microbacterium sp. 18062]|uniref:helix-turn-helix transcriptional regulator n=1 Tax=Microbacterium sp. 18062 TaxID=2681410 RepID=UPI00135A633D|nr:AAA family ATPase [Microbacterium sp. 18062]